MTFIGHDNKKYNVHTEMELSKKAENTLSCSAIPRILTVLNENKQV